jgi:hypothetical protein
MTARPLAVVLQHRSPVNAKITNFRNRFGAKLGRARRAIAKFAATQLHFGPTLSARALEFTVLTAVRTGETIGATWDEIDFAWTGHRRLCFRLPHAWCARHVGRQRRRGRKDGAMDAGVIPKSGWLDVGLALDTGGRWKGPGLTRQNAPVDLPSGPLARESPSDVLAWARRWARTSYTEIIQ